MKQGRSLSELAQEIERQAESKRDFLVPSDKMNMLGGKELVISDTHIPLGITPLCHEQIGSRLSIPRPYYDRMREEAPELLDRNVNHWLTLPDTDRRFLVRTLDGNARALLSERYRPLDNIDLAQAVLPVLSRAGCNVVSCELTDRRLYIKAVTPLITAEVKVGQLVQAGVVISNSEIGQGSISVDPLAYILSCLNGAIIKDSGMRRRHVGRSGNGDMEGAVEFFRDETRQQDDLAFWMKVTDIVTATMTEESFTKIVGRMRDATSRNISGDPIKVVEEVTKRYALTEGEGHGVLRHLIEEKDLTAWGLSNAITRTAHDVESYDRATELERLGGDVIELPRTDWEVLASRN